MFVLLLIVGCVETPSAPVTSGARLAGRSRVEVEVVDPGGAPRPGVWITLTPTGRDARTDSAGRVRFEALAAGEYHAVAGGGGVHRSEAQFSTDAGLVRMVVEPRNTTTGALQGLVTDAAGAALGGVTVRLGTRPVTTSPDGRYRLDAVVPGRHTFQVVPAAGEAAPWSSDRVDVAAGRTLELDVSLAGAPPASATSAGTGSCLGCHPEAATAWEASAHAQPRRSPRDLVSAAHPLVADFLAQPQIDLGDLGVARLRVVGEDWMVDVQGPGGAVLGTWQVTSVYGAHGPGAAFIGTRNDEPATLLPLTWGPDGPGHDQVQGFAAAYTERWQTTGPDPVAASFDLACAGCHLTGGMLVESEGTWSFAASGPAELESVVGCEACHGQGSAHVADPRSTSIVNPRRLDGARQVEVCARCHGRYEAGDHPFSEAPGWPTDPDGRMVSPVALRDHTDPDRATFVDVPASRMFADQAGDLFASPHHGGPLGYQGGCGDCHAAHGSANPADLHTDPHDDRLCTDCHRELRSLATQADHAGHIRFAPDRWSPGGCVGCHLPRVAPVGRRDPLSGVGDRRAHTLVAWHPDQVIAEFDALGVSAVAPGEAPVPGCLDCHAQASARLQDAGFPFDGPSGDPNLRDTYVELGLLVDRLWGPP